MVIELVMNGRIYIVFLHKGMYTIEDVHLFQKSLKAKLRSSKHAAFVQRIQFSVHNHIIYDALGHRPSRVYSM